MPRFLMQSDLLDHLRCPYCNSTLELETLELCTTGIKTAILTSPCRMFFPVIDGVPRMLLESFLDHQQILKKFYNDFGSRKDAVLAEYTELIHSAVRRNARSKKSFSLEWKLLGNRDHLRVWHTDAVNYRNQLFAEIDLPEEQLAGKKVIDVGCGHGRATRLLAARSALVIGMDLGSSVVDAAKNNASSNCHFIQADLHYPPFSPGYFDLVYSSGVLHHTEDTSRSFNTVSELTGANGILSVWLYRPCHDLVQRFMLFLRRFTVNLPVKLQFWLYLFTLTPLHWVISFIKGNHPHWREIMISQLDVLSPQFRHEHTPDEVKQWYHAHRFEKVTVTTMNEIGFSMKGSRIQ